MGGVEAMWNVTRGVAPTTKAGAAPGPMDLAPAARSGPWQPAIVRRPRARVALLACVALAACSDPWSGFEYLDPDDAMAGAIGPDTTWVRAVAALPYDSVRLSRWRWSGDELESSFTLTRSGGARYTGGEESAMKGRWEGSVSVFYVARLNHFIEGTGVLAALPPDSGNESPHGRVFRIEIWPRGEPEPLVYRGAETDGPTTAWALRAILDGLAAGVEWVAARDR